MSDTNNLELWDQVCVTNEAHTKVVTVGRGYTSIKPMYQIESATRVFGMQGCDWGVKPGSEEFTEKTYGSTVLLHYDAILYYKFKGKEGEVPIHASEKIFYITKNGKGYPSIDEDARKKVVTNAKTKGLSELGFNADVYKGLFDNNQYKAWANHQTNLKQQDENDKKFDEEIRVIKLLCAEETRRFREVKVESVLVAMAQSVMKTVRNKCELINIDQTPYTSGIQTRLDEQLAIIKELKNK